MLFVFFFLYLSAPKSWSSGCGWEKRWGQEARKGCEPWDALGGMEGTSGAILCAFLEPGFAQNRAEYLSGGRLGALVRIGSPAGGWVPIPRDPL